MEDKYIYSSLAEWRKAQPNAYREARNRNLLEKICIDIGWDINDIPKKSGYWTKEKCKEEALKYKSKIEWGKKDPSSYSAAYKKGWMDDCSSHMNPLINPNGYWTKERCIEEARKYNSRTEWSKNSSRSYQVSIKNNWLDECCTHMNELQKPTGYWTKEKCKKEALKFTSKSVWKKFHGASYNSALKKDWFEECCVHMVEILKPSGYWTKERCLEEAIKYSSKAEWRKKDNASYKGAYKNSWINECCTHMTELQKPPGYWTKERCMEEALKYSSKVEWCKKDSSSYSIAIKKEWYEECCTHMNELQKPNGYWTKERCMEEALKYNKKNEWQKNSSASYSSSYRNGWFHDCSKHMKSNKK